MGRICHSDAWREIRLLKVVIGNDVGNHTQHRKHREIVGGSRGRLRGPYVYGIKIAARVGETGWRHPVGSSLSLAERMLETEARVADDTDVASELQRMFALRPGEVVQEIVN